MPQPLSRTDNWQGLLVFYRLVRPPSADPLSAQKPEKKKKSGKKRGGQPGHKGHSRFFYEKEDCTAVLDDHPETCSCCGEKLSGEDARPYRHQTVDIPPIKPLQKQFVLVGKF